MSLRFKLLLIALSTLALPAAGWLFVRQMEELLRQGQEQTLIASARALARSLNALNAELPPAGNALYVHHAPSRINVDGYGGDWSALRPYTQYLGPRADAEKLSMLLCNDNERHLPARHRARCDAHARGRARSSRDDAAII